MILLYALIALASYYIIKLICKTFSSKEELKCDPNEITWFGEESRKDDIEDNSIKPFKVQIPDEVLSDLKERLKRTRYEEPLEDSNFEYGFNSNNLQSIVKYWLDNYNWKAQEKELNKYSQFKTKIEGIDIHFLHVKPDISGEKQLKVVPLLMIHGWPGSFYEFYKILPLLTTPNEKEGFVFEVICPSIPGYGYSEAPHKKGFNIKSAARIFVKLMKRIGFEKFFVQGGDWGAIISFIIGKYYPENVLGAHMNMYPYLPRGWDTVKAVAAWLVPGIMPEAEHRLFFPFWKKMGWILAETGYAHIQATKPDTIGCCISDSPAGLAAYILEKFSTWTHKDNPSRADGGLTDKFTLDELLTNVMIYWTGRTFASSARLYKESIWDRSHESVPLRVPCGLAMFPQEIMGIPRLLTSGQVYDLVSYTAMPRGGHFAAFEEPGLLAEDVRKFTSAVLRR